jgi:uncharacterized membrane protein
MGKGRLEAFSDGVIAILITIMVLELRVPAGPKLADLHALAPVLLAYLLSFIYLGIYWNNHHHMLHATERISGAVMWANLHLLFWLSLVPFVTRWVGEYHREAVPTAIYGVVLIAAAISYTILQVTIMRAQPHSRLERAVAGDIKGKISIVCYVAAIGLAFVDPWIADALYVVVAGIWFVPDRRIERVVTPSRG